MARIISVTDIPKYVTTTENGYEHTTRPLGSYKVRIQLTDSERDVISRALRSNALRTVIDGTGWEYSKLAGILTANPSIGDPSDAADSAIQARKVLEHTRNRISKLRRR